MKTNHTPKVSVVIAVYNGQKYLLEQLESILSQTLQPDEVIISDDFSVDDSYAITKDFIERNNLESWKLFRNSSNVGCANNFLNVIRRSTGDIIFLSDQDDVWKEEKIGDMVQCFEENKGIGVLSCKNDIVIDNDKKNIVRDTKNKKCKKVSYRQVFKTKPCMFKGCLIAFNKNIRDLLTNYGLFGNMHDGAVMFLGLMTDSYYVLEKSEIYYRLHVNQTAGESYIKHTRFTDNLSDRIELLNREDYIRNAARIAMEISPDNNSFQKHILNHLAINQQRGHALAQKNPLVIIKELPLMLQYLPISTIVSDMSYILGIRCFFSKILNGGRG